MDLINLLDLTTLGTPKIDGGTYRGISCKFTPEVLPNEPHYEIDYKDDFSYQITFGITLILSIRSKDWCVCIDEYNPRLLNIKNGDNK